MAAARGLPFKVKSVLDKLNAATTAANKLPLPEIEKGDYEFYHTSFPVFQQEMTRLGGDILQLTNSILKFQRPMDPVQLSDVDEVQDRFKEVVDQLDSILEIADTAFDEVSGVTKQTSSIVPGKQSAPLVLSMSPGGQGAKDLKLIHAQNILRPQLKFRDQIDNSSRPFVPIISRKYFEKASVDFKAYEAARAANAAALKIEMSDPRMHIQSVATQSIEEFAHPYQTEIKTIEYDPSLFVPCKEKLFKSLEETPVTWVDTVEKLQRCAKLLESEKEFAVDLEHHDYRSFQGFVCLMQLSTRNEDFLIDALALRSELHTLAPAFANPSIIKVLHGADSDIVWLQRDFGIYVVNLFDTGQAARVLNYPSFGLAHLLQHFANVTADKKYQLADWRIRPLPEEMFRYAREDTHYLLYIHDRMRNELLSRGNKENNLMWETLRKSEEISLKLCHKEVFDPTSYIQTFRKYNRHLTNEQTEVLQVLFAWRDNTARKEDENVRYVLPNHMLIHLAEVMPLNASAVVAACFPVPPLVRLKANEIAALVHAAKLQANRSAAAGVIAPPLPTEDAFNAVSELTRVVPGTPQSQINKSSKPNTPIATKTPTPKSFDKLSHTPKVAVSAPTLKKSSSLFGGDSDDEEDKDDHLKKRQTKSKQSVSAKRTLHDDSDEDVDAREAKRKAEEVRSQLILTPAFPGFSMDVSKPTSNEPETTTPAEKRRRVDNNINNTPGETTVSKGSSSPSSSTPPTKPALPTPLSQLKRKQASKDVHSNEAVASPKPAKKTSITKPNDSLPEENDASDVDALDVDQVTSRLKEKMTDAAAMKKIDEFDPYSNTKDNRKGKVNRSRVHQKSGNKSASFAVNNNNNKNNKK